MPSGSRGRYAARLMLWLLLITTLHASPVDQITAARQALDELRYADALSALPPESEVQGLTRAQVVDLLSTRALALAALKREADATQAFKQLFLIAHDWQVPDEYGPRVRTVALEAKDQAGRAGVLSLSYSAGQFQVTPDSTGWAKEVELTWRERGGPAQSVKMPLKTFPAPWPTSAPVDAWARVVGLQGSTLLEWGSEATPNRFAPEIVAPPPPPVAEAPGFFSRPLNVAGVAVGAAGLLAFIPAGVMAGQSGAANRALASATTDADGRITSPTQREAFNIAASADQAATVSGVFFVTGGVLLATGVGLLVYERVRVTPAPGGVGVLVPLDATFGLATEAR
jgi:hypothetical protein